MVGALLLSAPAFAAEPALEDFFPLVTRRPALEQEVAGRVEHAKGPRARETAGSLAVDLLLLPRWQVELAVPVRLLAPRGEPVRGGLGDIELENKVLLFQSAHLGALVTGGFAARLPTGSGDRGLGGEALLTPFLSAGLAPGGFFLVGEVAYGWQAHNPEPGPRSQDVQAGLVFGVPVGRWLIPLLEVTTVHRLRGMDDAGGPRLQGRQQVYLTPGLNIQILPEATLGLGVQVALTSARAADYSLLLSLDWGF